MGPRMRDPGGPQLAWYGDEDVSLDAFAEAVGRATPEGAITHTQDIRERIPVYDMEALRPTLMEYDRWALMSEWIWVLKDGPGAMVLKNSYRDVEPVNGVIDRVSAIFEQIIAEEGGGSGDHFAKSGANARIWNALEKLCLADPEAFLMYHGNPTIDAVCEAWCGPGYQMTAQVNVVRPGGAAQTAHRDYHLGFMSKDAAQDFPKHVHAVSPFLTLQGGIAHCDMPVESGPTKLLPFSQGYGPGYLAYHREDFAAFFEEHHVQLPLEKGDVIFFNPALFHGAGENRTQDVQRMANLMQVSSPMGRAMEAVDRAGMARALYSVYQRALATHLHLGNELAAALPSALEGYAFPTSLDTDPPKGGLAPETMAQLFDRAIQQGKMPEQFNAMLDAYVARRPLG